MIIWLSVENSNRKFLKIKTETANFRWRSAGTKNITRSPILEEDFWYYGPLVIYTYYKLFHHTEMASRLRITLVTCVLLFILMEDAKPVLAGKSGKKIKVLEAKVQALEASIQCKR